MIACINAAEKSDKHAVPRAEPLKDEEDDINWLMQEAQRPSDARFGFTVDSLSHPYEKTS